MNRLVACELQDKIVRYLYNDEGNRIEKIIEREENGEKIIEKRIQYGYYEGKLHFEDRGDEVISYFYGVNGEVSGFKVEKDGASTYYYYLWDQRGIVGILVEFYYKSGFALLFGFDFYIRIKFA